MNHDLTAAQATMEIIILIALPLAGGVVGFTIALDIRRRAMRNILENIHQECEDEKLDLNRENEKLSQRVRHLTQLLSKEMDRNYLKSLKKETPFNAKEMRKIAKPTYTTDERLRNEKDFYDILIEDIHKQAKAGKTTINYTKDTPRLTPIRGKFRYIENKLREQGFYVETQGEQITTISWAEAY